MPPKPTLLADHAAHVIAWCAAQVDDIADAIVPTDDVDLYEDLKDASDRLWYGELNEGYVALSGSWRRLRGWPTERLSQRLRAIEERLETIWTREDFDVFSAIADRADILRIWRDTKVAQPADWMRQLFAGARS